MYPNVYPKPLRFPFPSKLTVPVHRGSVPISDGKNWMAYASPLLLLVDWYELDVNPTFAENATPGARPGTTYVTDWTWLAVLLVKIKFPVAAMLARVSYVLA